MSVLSTGFEAPQTVPQQLGTLELYHMGDHSVADLESFYGPCPWNPKSVFWLVTLNHSAPYFLLHIWHPCSKRFPPGSFPLVGWISYPTAVLCLDANIAREVHFRKDNKLLWGTLGRWCRGGKTNSPCYRQTAPAGSKNAAERAAFLVRPACVQYPKSEQYAAI